MAKFLSLLYFALSCSSLTNVKDKHQTTLGLSVANNDPSKFLVNVSRQDVLVDTSGKTLAARMMSVLISFSIRDNMCCINGQKVSNLGQTQVVKANATFFSREVNNKEQTNLMKKFNQGLIAVELFTKVVDYAGITVVKNGTKPDIVKPFLVKQIIIRERIIEVDGKKVEQNEFVQQIFDVYSDGKIRRTMPIAKKLASIEEGTEDLTTQKSMSNYISAKLVNAKKHARIIALIVAFIIMLTFFFFILYCASKRYSRRSEISKGKYSSISPPPEYSQKAKFYEEEEIILTEQ